MGDSKGTAAGVLVELTRAQVDRVVRATAGKGTLATLLERGSVGKAGEQLPDRFNDPRLSRSLLVGLWVLSLMPTDGTWVSVSRIASIAEMSASTSQRYLATLVAVGIAERDPRTRKYRVATFGDGE
jgi:hypothetical protein